MNHIRIRFYFLSSHDGDDDLESVNDVRDDDVHDQANDDVVNDDAASDVLVNDDAANDVLANDDEVNDVLASDVLVKDDVESVDLANDVLQDLGSQDNDPSYYFASSVLSY